MEYLVLVPQNEPEMQIFVPVESVEQVGVRKIISEDTADRLLDSFSHMEADHLWENNFAKRRQAYLEILKKGSLESLVEMIGELSHQDKLSSGDKELLPRAQKKLFSEIALAKDMEFQRVMEIAQVRMQPAQVL